jgi:hypothetical protein
VSLERLPIIAVVSSPNAELGEVDLRTGHLVPQQEAVGAGVLRRGLAVRRRPRKRVAVLRRTPLPTPTAVDERWSMDFVSNALGNGRRFRPLTIDEEGPGPGRRVSSAIRKAD